jgi:hypothetical protein
MKQTHIYLVENCYGDKNKVYIGKSINPEQRKKMHKSTYGSQIMFTVIDSINSDKHRDWVPLESYWIEQFKHWGFSLMNTNSGGAGPEYCSKETRLKLSLAKKGKPNNKLKGKKVSNETKLKMSLAHKGIKYSEESKLKMRQLRSEETKLKMSLSAKGKSRSEETKLKMSLARKGNKCSEETKAKMRKPKSEETKAKMRKPKSEEHKLKMSQSMIGRKYSNEHKLNMSLAAKGKFKSEETKLKMSLARKGKKYKKHVFEK